MRHRLTELLHCLKCRSPLELSALREEARAYDFPGWADWPIARCRKYCSLHHRPVSELAAEEVDCRTCYSREIVEGLLTCRGCGKKYPVIAGIPRLLPEGLENILYLKYRDFFARAGDRISLTGIDDRTLRGVRKTFDSFNTQWSGSVGSRFLSKKMFSGPAEVTVEGQRDRIRQVIQGRLEKELPSDPEFYQGKLGADMGCGMGHGTGYVASFGCEMVGMDLTFGLERGCEYYRDNPFVHYVQANIFDPPFRDEAFDFAYSLGVIHHTPDPPRAFASAAKVVSLGGRFFIFVYALKEMKLTYRLSHLTFLRPFVAPLPIGTRNFVCLVLAVIFKIALALFFGLVRLIPRLRRRMTAMPFYEFSTYTVNGIAINFFDRLSPPYTFYHTQEELTEWYRRAGFGGIRITLRDGGRGWNGDGVKLPPRG